MKGQKGCGLPGGATQKSLWYSWIFLWGVWGWTLFCLNLTLILPISSSLAQGPAQELVATKSSPPVKLKGKALKEKMASLEVFQKAPDRAYTRLGPLWASKNNMEKTMKNLRKQAAKLGGDAIIDLRVRTEKLRSMSYDPGWWGPGYGGGFRGYGGWWGGMSYWGGYAQAHTYTQPVVTGWAVRWNDPKKNSPDLVGQDPGR